MYGYLIKIYGRIKHCLISIFVLSIFTQKSYTALISIYQSTAVMKSVILKNLPSSL
jgi:uncharacterized membrane protein (Fun14 family)